MGDLLNPTPRIPARYEDLATEFRARLRPNRELIEATQRARKSCEISYGIRFLPVYGRSGSGKTSAALELATHLVNTVVKKLDHTQLTNKSSLLEFVRQTVAFNPDFFPIFVIDQYEESVARKEDVPTQFLEILSLFDRNELNRMPCLFVWLTTDEQFQADLVSAANRNERLLLESRFQLLGPSKDEWPQIISELFEFHNQGRQLADFQVLESDLFGYSQFSPTIGHAILKTAEALSSYVEPLHDLSSYTVYMLWPVTDALRIQRVQQFSNAKHGYVINWNAWYHQVGEGRGWSYKEMNKARLYFDMRLVPIQAADLYPLMQDLLIDEPEIAKSHIERFKKTHFFRLISSEWDSNSYKSLLERKESQRAENAANWYSNRKNRDPVAFGKRLAYVLRECGFNASYEQYVESSSGRVRADVLVLGRSAKRENVIIELKVFSAENSRPSDICEQIRITMRRHAELLGLVEK